jgi:histone H2A
MRFVLEIKSDNNGAFFFKRNKKVHHVSIFWKIEKINQKIQNWKNFKGKKKSEKIFVVKDMSFGSKMTSGKGGKGGKGGKVRAGKSKKNPQSRSLRAGLQVSHWNLRKKAEEVERGFERSSSQWEGFTGSWRTESCQDTESEPLLLYFGILYVEVIYLAGKSAIILKLKRATPWHLILAIRGNVELNNLVLATIIEGGIAPWGSPELFSQGHGQKKK